MAEVQHGVDTGSTGKCQSCQTQDSSVSRCRRPVVTASRLATLVWLRRGADDWLSLINLLCFRVGVAVDSRLAPDIIQTEDRHEPSSASHGGSVCSESGTSVSSSPYRQCSPARMARVDPSISGLVRPVLGSIRDAVSFAALNNLTQTASSCSSASGPCGTTCVWIPRTGIHMPFYPVVNQHEGT
jgi:hypothetical protein